MKASSPSSQIIGGMGKFSINYIPPIVYKYRRICRKKYCQLLGITKTRHTVKMGYLILPKPRPIYYPVSQLALSLNIFTINPKNTLAPIRGLSRMMRDGSVLLPMKWSKIAISLRELWRHSMSHVTRISSKLPSWRSKRRKSLNLWTRGTRSRLVSISEIRRRVKNNCYIRVKFIEMSAFWENWRPWDTSQKNKNSTIG